MEENKVRVLILDDHPIVRLGLVRLINQEADLVVCGEVGDPAEALDAVRDLAPDIVLLDVELEGGNGLDLIPEIQRVRPGLPILVISMHDNPEYLRRALSSGARGYIHKRDAIQRVIPALRQVVEGEVYVSETMVDQVLTLLVDVGPEASTPVSKLTDREREVLELIGQGYPARQIAERLNISPKTVNSHRENIKKKLELANSAELDQFAIRWVHGNEGG